MKEISKKNILVGYKLKQLRMSKGYTQHKVAEALGVSAQHYGTLERGDNSLSLDNVLKLCDFYNITIMSILGELRKTDRKTRSNSQKLVYEIEELKEEHKRAIKHMVKFYRQVEKQAIQNQITQNKNKEDENEEEQIEQEETAKKSKSKKQSISKNTSKKSTSKKKNSNQTNSSKVTPKNKKTPKKVVAKKTKARTSKAKKETTKKKEKETVKNSSINS